MAYVAVTALERHKVDGKHRHGQVTCFESLKAFSKQNDGLSHAVNLAKIHTELK